MVRTLAMSSRIGPYPVGACLLFCISSNRLPPWQADKYVERESLSCMKPQFAFQYSQVSQFSLPWSKLIPLFPPCFLEFQFNIILPSSLGLQSSLFPLIFPYRNSVRFCLLHSHHLPRPYYCPSFDNVRNIWWGVQITKQIIMQFSPSPGTNSLWRPNSTFGIVFYYPRRRPLFFP